MDIPYWIGSVIILGLIGGFVVFSYRQGMAVKPRGSNSKFWWQAVPALPRPEENDSEGDEPEGNNPRQEEQGQKLGGV